jgi:hypothetical protein
VRAGWPFVWKLVLWSLSAVAWVVIGFAVLMEIPVVNIYVMVLCWVAAAHLRVTGGVLAGIGGLGALVRWTMHLDRRNRALSHGVRP